MNYHQGQEKLYYQNKVSHIMESYQKQQQEEHQKKETIKKQIMLSILQNRDKHHPIQPTTTTFPLVPSKQLQDPQYIIHDNCPQDHPTSGRMDPKAKTFGQELRQCEQGKEVKVECMFQQLSLQLQLQMSIKDDRVGVRQPGILYNEGLSVMKDFTFKPQSRHLQEDEQFRASHLNQLKQRRLQSQQDYQQNNQNQAQLHPHTHNHSQHHSKPLFITLQQSQSMHAQQLNQNYAFQINNHHSIDIANFQHIKTQKIRDIERKRQERIEQFRRNESSKKVQMPKGRSSLIKRSDKSDKKEAVYNESDNYPKKSSNDNSNKALKPSSNLQLAIQKQGSRNASRNIDSESNYNFKAQGKPSSPYDPLTKPTTNYQNIHQDKQRPLSPFRTPKTLQHRNKSHNKHSNIFSQNASNREKSVNKLMGEPKIQPKDRKNTFTKQSNKKLMVNAITQVIFPGELNRKERQRLIEVLESSQYEFFVFLFKEYSRKMIKGIYVLDASQKRIERIYGDKAPFQITAEKVEEFYRFDSGSRQFKKVDGCKSFSLSIHAVDAK